VSIRRREFITLVGGAAAWPMAVRAQHGERTRRVGILIQLSEADPEAIARLGAFRTGLQSLGWRIGDNLLIDTRWDISTDERAHAAMVELLKLEPDVVVANSTVALRAAQQATHTVPIVFTTVIDPVGQGFVTNLAHPGGNTTGFSALEPAVGAKWLDLLKKTAPFVKRIAFMFNPERGPYGARISSFAQEAAQNFDIQYVAAPVAVPLDIETAIAALANEPSGGLIVSPDAFTVRNRKLIVDQANAYKLPAMYMTRNYAVEGGLISYGPNYLDHFRQAAIYVDKILKGDKPANLPVQEPVNFELVINLKTAKALGLDVPLQLLQIADEVIE